MLVQVYTRYGEYILPKILQVFNAAYEAQCLSESMSMVLLLRPGEDPLDPGSYRPILVLQCNVKILAKVLAMRPNEVILSIIHADQAGFMPHKSSALNLRRLFLNMQTPLDNMGQHALLSLDANKVFDSIER